MQFKTQIIPGILSTISRKLQNQSRPLFYFCQPHSSILNTIIAGVAILQIISELSRVCRAFVQLLQHCS